MKESVIKSSELSSYVISDFAKEEPEIIETTYKKLKDDIEANGLQNPVVVYNKEIYDGRHRFKIAKELGIDLKVIEAEGRAEAERIAISNNKHRRHLSKSQYAMMAAREIIASNKSITINKSPYIVDKTVSERYVKNAKKIAEKDKSLADEVFNGKISIEDAIKELNKKKPKKSKNKEDVVDTTKKFLTEKLDKKTAKEFEERNKEVGLSKAQILKEYLYIRDCLLSKLVEADDSINAEELLESLKKELS